MGGSINGFKWGMPPSWAFTSWRRCAILDPNWLYRELLLPILGSVKKSLRGYIARLAEPQFMANRLIVTGVHLQYIYCQLAWKLWASTKLPRTGYRISMDITWFQTQYGNGSKLGYQWPTEMIMFSRKTTHFGGWKFWAIAIWKHGSLTAAYLTRISLWTFFISCISCHRWTPDQENSPSTTPRFSSTITDFHQYLNIFQRISHILNRLV